MKKQFSIILSIMCFLFLTSCSIANSNTRSNTTESNSVSTIGNETSQLTPRTRSNRLAELIEDSYKDLTEELKEEYESYLNSFKYFPIPFTYLNKEEYEKIGGTIVYGVFNGYIVYYPEPVVFERYIEMVANYGFYVGNGIKAYKNEHTYTLLNAYESGLLTDNDVAKIYEIHKRYCIDLELNESLYDSLYNSALEDYTRRLEQSK